MNNFYVKELVRSVLITCFTKGTKESLTQDFLMECSNIAPSKPLLVRDHKSKFWLYNGEKLSTLKTTNYVQALETVRTRSTAKSSN